MTQSPRVDEIERLVRKRRRGSGLVTARAVHGALAGMVAASGTEAAQVQPPPLPPPPHQPTQARLALGFATAGVLSSRSVMLPELTGLLGVGPPIASLAAFRRLAIEDDALHKASAANRKKTFNFLARLYALDPRVALFREALRLQRLFPADLRALMGLLALAREPLLRACADMVLATPVGHTLGRDSFEAWIRDFAPGRYTASMYASFSHNLYAAFFQLGHLGPALGKVRLRLRPVATPAVVAYAAFLDWLDGANGLSLLGGRYSRTLALARAEHLNLLSAAGRLGLMRVAHSGGVLQLDFAAWLAPGEVRQELRQLSEPPP